MSETAAGIAVPRRAVTPLVAIDLHHGHETAQWIAAVERYPEKGIQTDVIRIIAKEVEIVAQWIIRKGVVLVVLLNTTRVVALLAEVIATTNIACVAQMGEIKSGAFLLNVRVHLESETFDRAAGRVNKKEIT